MVWQPFSLISAWTLSKLFCRGRMSYKLNKSRNRLQHKCRFILFLLSAVSFQEFWHRRRRPHFQGWVWSHQEQLPISQQVWRVGQEPVSTQILTPMCRARRAHLSPLSLSSPETERSVGRKWLTTSWKPTRCLTARWASSTHLQRPRMWSQHSASTALALWVKNYWFFVILFFYRPTVPPRALDTETHLLK